MSQVLCGQREGRCPLRPQLPRAPLPRSACSCHALFSRVFQKLRVWVKRPETTTLILGPQSPLSRQAPPSGTWRDRRGQRPAPRSARRKSSGFRRPWSRRGLQNALRLVEPRLRQLSSVAAAVPATHSYLSRRAAAMASGRGQSLWPGDHGAAHPRSAGQGVIPSLHMEPPDQGLGAKPQSRTSKAPLSTQPPVNELCVILSPGHGARGRCGLPSGGCSSG